MKFLDRSHLPYLFHAITKSTVFSLVIQPLVLNISIYMLPLSMILQHYINQKYLSFQVFRTTVQAAILKEERMQSKAIFNELHQLKPQTEGRCLECDAKRHSLGVLLFVYFIVLFQ